RGHPDLAAEVVQGNFAPAPLGEGKVADGAQLVAQGVLPDLGSDPGDAGQGQDRQPHPPDAETPHGHHFTRKRTTGDPGGGQSQGPITMSGSSTIMNMVPRMSTGMTMKYTRPQSYFRCMKYRATSRALQTATERMITKPVWDDRDPPRTSPLTTKETTVKT